MRSLFILALFVSFVFSCKTNQKVDEPKIISKIIVELKQGAELEKVDKEMEEISFQNARPVSRSQNIWHVEALCNEKGYSKLMLELNKHPLVKRAYQVTRNTGVPINSTNQKSGKTKPIKK